MTLEIPLARVTPPRWKAAYGLRHAEKAAAVSVARRLYPLAPYSTTAR